MRFFMTHTKYGDNLTTGSAGPAALVSNFHDCHALIHSLEDEELPQQSVGRHLVEESIRRRLADKLSRIHV
jgi:hypothetical protein